MQKGMQGRIQKILKGMAGILVSYIAETNIEPKPIVELHAF